METKKVDYSEMVKTLVKPGADIQTQMSPEKANVWHLATGVVGEAGELIDAVKKWVAYNKPLDKENVKEELGDIEFYLEGLRQAVGLTREEILNANIDKLSVRYQGLKYSDKAAQDRADKVA